LFAANTVRFQLHARDYYLGSFLRTLANAGADQGQALMSLKEKLIKIDAIAAMAGRAYAASRLYAYDCRLRAHARRSDRP
jgi:hypothetical protein